MDVGQGDGAILISPQGEVVLFDNGVRNNCDKPVSYLRQLGIAEIDYHIASHYHADHIGCTTEVLQQFPLQNDAFDRGGSYGSSTYERYVSGIGTHRKTAEPGMTITLDSDTPYPVTIVFVALNGDGMDTTDENSLSLVAVIHFGDFDAEMGGDLTGYRNGGTADVETSVAPRVGQIEVYKVHHHCSRYSSNDFWLTTVTPLVAIVSAGDRNPYGHPTEQCLDRLHAAGVKTYWTELGNGANPDPTYDAVGGNIVVESAPGSDTFTVTYNNGELVDTYPLW